MKDRLEEYIRQNRLEFETEIPPEQTWKKIRVDITRNSNANPLGLKFYLSRAAIILVIFASGFILSRVFYSIEPGKTNQISRQEKEIKIPELEEAEAYYSNLVNNKLREVSPMLMKHPEIKKDIHADFSELDSIYAELKTDLNDNIANQEVIEAMIQNYRLKLEILEDILAHFKSLENNNDKSKEEYEI
jgi:hypothetical protein